MAIIRTENLTRKYRDLVAVDNLSLVVEEGECFGLLGPNGAGKTTLIRMITAVSPPTSGSIWVDGRDISRHPREVKKLLGVVPQVDNLDPDLTVIQNLMTFARYFEIPRQVARQRAFEVLSLFQLEDKKGSRIRELSGGMKRRLLIARGLINRPRIIILDEPTIGLDPQARHLVWQKLKELKADGVSEVLCTQNMEEAQLLCDRLAIMHQGRVLETGTPRALISQLTGERVWEVDTTAGDGIIAELKRNGLEYEESDGILKIFHLVDEELAERIKARPRTATLEDVFFRLTGRSLVE